jgi:hypothetical protein
LQSIKIVVLPWYPAIDSKDIAVPAWTSTLLWYSNVNQFPVFLQKFPGVRTKTTACSSYKELIYDYLMTFFYIKWDKRLVINRV